MLPLSPLANVQVSPLRPGLLVQLPDHCYLERSEAESKDP